MAAPKRSKPKKRQPGKRGPKPSITLEVVKRVGLRYGRGVPLEQALAAECNAKINLDTWHKALQKDEKLSTQWAGARGKFLERAVAKLAESDNLARLCWLLERRHSDLFAKRNALPPAGYEGQRSTELPTDIIERARELATGGKHG